MSHRLQLIAESISSQKKDPLGTDVYIVAAKRTPIGSYMGKLTNYSGPELAGFCIKSALESIKLKPSQVEQVILGNVVSAGVGQSPARQAAFAGGLGIPTICTTVNKVCSSGMKSIVFGSQSIELGHNNVVIAGGFESMSNAPHMIKNARKGLGHGDKVLVDALTHDGLTDAYHKISMGLCAQKTAKQYKITREDQDNYCKMSYQRHIQSAKNNYYKDEITPIPLKGNEQFLTKDEEVKRYKQEAITKLKPAFDKAGTITSANASKINDGACCVVLMSGPKLKELNLQPLARIVAYADAEVEPTDFSISPYYATLKVLKKANLSVEDIDFFEYNEAFSIVPILLMQKLNISKEKVNILGGAVAMGHPIGMSGARIVQSLITTLKLKKGKYGLAGICNGGGGSTAIIVENMQ